MTSRAIAFVLVTLMVFLFLVGGGIAGSYVLLLHYVDTYRVASHTAHCANVHLVYNNTYPRSKLHEAFGVILHRDCP